MKRIKFMACAGATAILCGCGGGGGGSGNAGDQAASLIESQKSTAGATWVYQEAYKTDGDNTVNLQLQEVRGLTNEDGSYSLQISEGSSKIYVRDTAYGGTAYTEYFYANGDKVRVPSNSGELTSTCSNNSTPTGMPRPLYLNSTWGGDWSTTCSSGGMSSVNNFHLANGHVVGVEVLTVPAGTYQAVHVSDELDVNMASTPFIQQLFEDRWYDSATGRLLQTSVTYNYQGATPAAGYLKQLVSKLQSYKPGV